MRKSQCAGQMRITKHQVLSSRFKMLFSCRCSLPFLLFLPVFAPELQCCLEFEESLQLKGQGLSEPLHLSGRTFASGRDYEGIRVYDGLELIHTFANAT